MRGKGLCLWELSSNAVHRCVIRHHGLQPEGYIKALESHIPAPRPLVKMAEMPRYASFISSPFSAIMLARKGIVSLPVQDSSFLSKNFGCKFEMLRSQLQSSGGLVQKPLYT